MTQETGRNDSVQPLTYYRRAIHKKKISELVDFKNLQTLLDYFYEVVGIADAIIDLDGIVLLGSGWQDTCTKYHRVHPVTCAKCIGSDTSLATRMLKGEEYALYRCPNGLVDAALVTGLEAGANDYLMKPVSKNELLARVKTHLKLHHLNTAYSRFVPHEFLKFLNKESIVDIQLGDHLEKEMTLLFSDIRNFTSLSEKMTPKENFDFINAYLSIMAPIITQHQGFIDKYIGDAIMALFPTSADEAVSTSIVMLKKLAAYNKKRQKSGLEPIAIGIGLNTGLLMLGTIGDENRMDGTVISDAVNLASRIEGMTKMYGAALLISEETYAHLNDVSQYAIRTIDRVTVKGKSEPVTVYEVFDGDAPSLLELKMQTREDFESGLIHYREKEFVEAITCFEQVLQININDQAAKIYINRCKHWKKVGIPSNWMGVEILDSK